MSKQDIVSTDDFWIGGELHDGMLFLHCEVVNFNKNVLKQIRGAFEEILEGSWDRGLTEVFSITPNERFVKALGHEYKVIAEENNNRLVVWEKELYLS
jgi:hypothetical protein